MRYQRHADAAAIAGSRERAVARNAHATKRPRLCRLANLNGNGELRITPLSQADLREQAPAPSAAMPPSLGPAAADPAPANMAIASHGQGLSLPDFKRRLFAQLESQGVVSSLKVRRAPRHFRGCRAAPCARGPLVTCRCCPPTPTPTPQSQLRSQLLAQLQSLNLAPLSPQQQPSPWQRAANELVLDYLAAQGYQYSASVFKPESRAAGGGALQLQQLQELLRLRPDGALVRAIGEQLEQQRGGGACLLLALLRAVACLPEGALERAQQQPASQVGCRSAHLQPCSRCLRARAHCTQAHRARAQAAAASQQLARLEQEAGARAGAPGGAPQGLGRGGAEEVMARYRWAPPRPEPGCRARCRASALASSPALAAAGRAPCRRECDARVAAEVSRQVDAFRRVELGAARLEEEARCRAQLEAERAQLDAATREAAARCAPGQAAALRPRHRAPGWGAAGTPWLPEPCRAQPGRG
jgi:hypothetical protein